MTRCWRARGNMSWKSQSSWRPIHPAFRATVEKTASVIIATAKREAASLQLAN